MNVTSGDVQLAYDEETKAGTTAGHIDVPRTFTVRLAPWVGVDPVDITARLRWRIENGHLRIGYALLRPDRAKADVFETVLSTVCDGIEGLPLFYGKPPASVLPLT